MAVGTRLGTSTARLHCALKTGIGGEAPSRYVGDIDFLIDALHAILFAGNLLERLTVGVQLLILGLIDASRVLVVLYLCLELVNLLLVAVDAHVVVLTEEQQHQDECYKDDEWQIEPSRYPFGSLKLHDNDY